MSSVAFQPSAMRKDRAGLLIGCVSERVCPPRRGLRIHMVANMGRIVTSKVKHQESGKIVLKKYLGKDAAHERHFGE